MNRDTELKIQAYADGELPPGENRQTAELLAEDSAARALHEELQQVKRLLTANEPQYSVPETREFYWSKIARAIEHEAARPAPSRGWIRVPAWLRWFAPAAGMAAVLALLVFGRAEHYSPFQISHQNHLDEEEALYFPTSTITFRSEAQGMTVLWVQNRWD